MRRAAVALACLLLAGCGDRTVPAARFGARLFHDPRLSTSPVNVFSCATCHVVDAAPATGRFDPGFDLAGASARGSWWGGHELRLLDAMNACLEGFMGGARLDPADPRAQELYALMDQDAPDALAAPLALTFDRTPTALAGVPGDAAAGRAVWDGACRRCHGDAHTGRGRLSTRVSLVPEDTMRVFPQNARAVVVEKIRHGRFFSIGGAMPPYALEVLTDRAIADLLAYLGL